jgi:hypothetical protein
MHCSHHLTSCAPITLPVLPLPLVPLQWGNRWVNVGVLLAFIAASRVLFGVSLRYLHYEKR